MDQISDEQLNRHTKLYEAINKAPPPPCLECQNLKRCGKEMLACLDFEHYILKGDIKDKLRKPSSTVYHRIYLESKAKEPA